MSSFAWRVERQERRNNDGYESGWRPTTGWTELHEGESLFDYNGVSMVATVKGDELLIRAFYTDTRTTYAQFPFLDPEREQVVSLDDGIALTYRNLRPSETPVYIQDNRTGAPTRKVLYFQPPGAV